MDIPIKPSHHHLSNFPTAIIIIIKFSITMSHLRRLSIENFNPNYRQTLDTKYI